MNCAYWLQIGRTGQRVEGVCRRRAPLPNMRIAETSFWPATKPTDWCGEYEVS